MVRFCVFLNDLENVGDIGDKLGWIVMVVVRFVVIVGLVLFGVYCLK